MKKIIAWFKQLIRWALRSEIKSLYDEICKIESRQERVNKQYVENKALYKRITSLLNNIDASVDYHHHYGKSWAVISLQGNQYDYIKFVDLRDKDIHEIQCFLKQFDRSKVDAGPVESSFLRIKRRNKYF